jgi:hypothetical protein
MRTYKTSYRTPTNPDPHGRLKQHAQVDAAVCASPQDRRTPCVERNKKAMFRFWLKCKTTWDQIYQHQKPTYHWQCFKHRRVSVDNLGNESPTNAALRLLVQRANPQWPTVQLCAVWDRHHAHVLSALSDMKCTLNTRPITHNAGLNVCVQTG